MTEHIELIGAIFRQAIWDDTMEIKARIHEELVDLQGFKKSAVDLAISNESAAISQKVRAFVLTESPKWPRNTKSDAVRNRNKIYKESLASCKKYIEGGR